MDFNDAGHYYRIGVDTAESKEVVEAYLQRFSQDVRYHKSQEKRTRKDKGNRKTSVGVICYCKYCYDKINTFNKSTSTIQADSRHLNCQEVLDGQAC